MTTVITFLIRIQVNKSWNVKICDFGISKLSAAATGLTTICCTPGYAAPEIFDDRIADQSDMFSFGILLYDI